MFKNINVIQRVEGIFYCLLGLFVFSVMIKGLLNMTVLHISKIFIVALIAPIKVLGSCPPDLVSIYVVGSMFLIMAHSIFLKWWALILTFLSLIFWIHMGLMMTFLGHN